MNRQRISWRIAYLFTAFGIYMVDQASKAWAVRALRFGETKTLIGGILDLTYAENPGIAFGQLQEGGSFGRWFFVVLAVAAGLAVLIYFFRTTRNDDRILGACALLLAGIAGNLTDRARLGHVIDFILLHYKEYHWPVFNVADMSICAGAFLLIYDMFVSGRRERRKNTELGSAKSPEARTN
ncbi:MAG TPA: signal peptidase II [Pyrinomonadaceae bacterium]|nr:signal peptidase II [Pyrinomonadaceae bacterium]